MKAVLVAVTIACFIAVFSVGGAKAQDLMCYNCTYATFAGFSGGDTGCLDPFSSTGISKVACDGVCKKAVLSGSIETMQRTCQTAIEGECVNFDKFEYEGTVLTQKCCSTNLCNSAGAVAFNLVAAMVAVLGALAIRH